MRINHLLYGFLLFVSCNTKNNTPQESINYTVKYATGFLVEKHPEYTKVVIRNPWDTLQNLQEYVLIQKGEPLPESLPSGTIVRVPLERVVAYGALQCTLLDQLNEREAISGVCESQYIHIDFIKEKVRKGLIPDLGESVSPDIEKIIDLNPEAILTSPFPNGSYGKVAKTGIPIIECADYMEKTPLGRAEWLRFHGLFYNKEEYADSLFTEIENRYNGLKSIAAGENEKPSVISEQKIGSTWYVPGGASYVANLFKDAGADYLWADDTNAGSLALSFEEVFDKGSEADFWLIKYNASTPLSYETLEKNFLLNAQFKAWKERSIFTCNTGEVAYYEETPFQPDLLLKDLIRIFHPTLLQDTTARYFQPMVSLK